MSCFIIAVIKYLRRRILGKKVFLVLFVFCFTNSGYHRRNLGRRSNLTTERKGTGPSYQKSLPALSNWFLQQGSTSNFSTIFPNKLEIKCSNTKPVENNAIPNNRSTTEAQ